MGAIDLYFECYIVIVKLTKNKLHRKTKNFDKNISGLSLFFVDKKNERS